MQIVDTPGVCLRQADPELQCRTRGYNSEEAFLHYARSHEIVTSYRYLPVQWWQTCVVYCGLARLKNFSAVPFVQQFIDGLDRRQKYFTVSRCDDGPYETLPPDTVVFGVSTGDIPIPLLCEIPTMKIETVPAQRERLRNTPDRAFGFNIESHAAAWFRLHAGELNSQWAYLPVLWWNNSAAEMLATGKGPFRAVVLVQEFLDNLPPGKRVTVSRGADGIYERLPDNTVVFSAGGKGDFPIPHLTEAPDVPVRRERDILASFVGNIACGGPVKDAPHGASSWDPNGAGATVRRAMAKVFSGAEDCLIVDQNIGTWSRGIPLEYVKFRQAAEQSWFGLAPRGYGKTSYRLYEMFHFGCIPVYIYDEPWIPYQDRLDWTEFSVLCHVSELPDLPQRLRSMPIAKREQMIEAAKPLIEDYFTQDGVCKQIAYYVEKL